MGKPVDISTDKAHVLSEIKRAANFGKEMIDSVVKEKLEELEVVRTFKPATIESAERVVISDIEAPNGFDWVEIRIQNVYADSGFRLNKKLEAGNYRLVLMVLKR